MGFEKKIDAFYLSLFITNVKENMDTSRKSIFYYYYFKLFIVIGKAFKQFKFDVDIHIKMPF